MELELKNKVAFVAASSQGLGKSVATELAQEGARVIINGRFKESLERTKDEIEKEPPQRSLESPATPVEPSNSGFPEPSKAVSDLTISEGSTFWSIARPTPSLSLFWR